MTRHPVRIEARKLLKFVPLAVTALLLAGCERWRHELAEPKKAGEPVPYQYALEYDKLDAN